MTCASIYAPQLRARGFRMTPQRMAILHVLHHAGTHLTPSEVYSRARREMPGLTEPTVYRTLSFLAEQGMVHAAHIGSGQLIYEYACHEGNYGVANTLAGARLAEKEAAASAGTR